jgi:MSHA biogenesis protein MshO
MNPIVASAPHANDRLTAPAKVARAHRCNGGIAPWHERGFTLVEAVVVIVITAIVATVTAVFIRLPVQGYVETVARAELTDVADLAVRRMARDLRLALPNSVRISADGRYLELLLTKAGGRYLSDTDPPGPPGSNILDFETAANCVTPPIPDACKFDVVGLPLNGEIVAGDAIVVYNLGAGFAPANAYDGGNLAWVRAVNSNTVTLASNPFSQQTPRMRSPANRFQVVTTPVTYFCNGADGGDGTLTRFWNYTIAASQPDNAAALATGSNPQKALIASNVVNCVFSAHQLANTRTGLIGVALTLRTPNGESGTVVLSHQVHVDNTP